MYSGLIGKKLSVVKKQLDEKGLAYNVILTSPPREDKNILEDSRVLRIKINKDDSLEILVSNLYTTKTI